MELHFKALQQTYRLPGPPLTQVQSKVQWHFLMRKSVFVNGSDEDDLPPALAAAAAASTPVSSASPGSQKTCTPQTSEGQTQVSPGGKVTHREMSSGHLGQGSARLGGSCE